MVEVFKNDTRATATNLGTLAFPDDLPSDTVAKTNVWETDHVYSVQSLTGSGISSTDFTPSDDLHDYYKFSPYNLKTIRVEFNARSTGDYANMLSIVPLQGISKVEGDLVSIWAGGSLNGTSYDSWVLDWATAIERDLANLGLFDFYGDGVTKNDFPDSTAIWTLTGEEVIFDVNGFEIRGALENLEENESSFARAFSDVDFKFELFPNTSAPNLDEATEGTPGPDRLIDTGGNNTVLLGKAGDDIINGGQGNDQINGGEGQDISEHSGSQSSYSITISSSGIFITDRRSDGDGNDELIDIEYLRFLDGDWQLEKFSNIINLSAANLTSFLEVYIAYFDRAADSEGLFFWGTAFANGTTLESIATLFNDSDEAKAAYPSGTTNQEFAITVYENVLGRNPDSSGLEFWVGQLNAGNVSRDQFILEVLRGVKDGTSDRDYLDKKVDVAAYFSVIKGMSDLDNAKAVMDAFGDQDKADLTAARSIADTAYSSALDPLNGEFMLTLVGILDDPFAGI
jgi:hypothetical protein